MRHNPMDSFGPFFIDISAAADPPLTVPWNMLLGNSMIQYKFSFYLFGSPTLGYFKVSGTGPMFFAFFTIESL